MSEKIYEFRDPVHGFINVHPLELKIIDSPPFSHASEELFPDGLTHEDYTHMIITQTEIADYIRKIGEWFKKHYGDEYDITPELISSIYKGENIENPDFMFLKKFMDSELEKKILF